MAHTCFRMQTGSLGRAPTWGERRSIRSAPSEATSTSRQGRFSRVLANLGLKVLKFRFVSSRPDDLSVLGDRMALLERQVDELRRAQTAAAQEDLIDKRVVAALAARRARRGQRLRDGGTVAAGLGGVGVLAELVAKALGS